VRIKIQNTKCCRR